jgi:predicted AAA+ superfamily ATPase
MAEGCYKVAARSTTQRTCKSGTRAHAKVELQWYNIAMEVNRNIVSEIQEYLSYFPVVSVSGPRQSGKTTMLKEAFPNYRYITLEDPEMRQLAISSPKDLLQIYDNKVIIDEAQYAPELFSYIQVHIDERGQNGMYILSGSQNFLMSERISQSLAGRVGIVRLLPFSYSEVLSFSNRTSLHELVFYGGYPRLLVNKIRPSSFFESYINTYLERDVRTLRSIANLQLFKSFIKLLANRAGEVIKYDNIAKLVGISIKTLHAWLSVLEASYIIFFVPPYYNNFDKRITKSPKLYFYDTGLVAYLMGFKKPDDLILSRKIGHLFENYIFTEMLKKQWTYGESNRLYYWRENDKNGVDLLYENGDALYGYEIKASQSFRFEYFGGLNRLAKISEREVKKNVIYNGETLKLEQGTFLSFRDLLDDASMSE